jgi:adenylosuccinate synthase
MRAYGTRHGAGPFVTEDKLLTARVQDAHNEINYWQREFRVGYLDFVALRYALEVTGRLDGLVITNLDRLDGIPQWRTCDLYQYAGDKANLADKFDFRDQFVSNIKVPADPTNLVDHEERTRLLGEMKPIYADCPTSDRNDYIELICQVLNVPIAITSAGATALEKSSFFAMSNVDYLNFVR